MPVDLTPMWDGQSGAVEFNVARKKGIDYMDPGLGKTRVYYESWNRTAPGRIHLAIGNKASATAYISQGPRWCEQLRGRFDMSILTGAQPQKKEQIWKHALSGKARLIHTSPATLMKEFGRFPWDKIGFVSWDECDTHRQHFSSQQKPGKQKLQAKAIEDAFKQVEYGCMGSGTLMDAQCLPTDIFLYLKIVNPQLFSSFYKYQNTWCETIATPYGTKVIGPKNLENFRKYVLRQNIYRLQKSEDRPPMVRSKVPMEMSPTQRKMYDTLVNELMLETSIEMIASPSKIAIQSILRKVLISPRLIEPAAELGPTFDYLEDLLEEDPHIAIFTPFREAVELIATWLQAKGHEPLIFYGNQSETADQLLAKANHFNRNKSGKTVAVGTVEFGRGYELPSARQAIFCGYHYTPGKNYQAYGRLDRENVPMAREAKFLTYADSVDEDIMDNLNIRAEWSRLTWDEFRNIIYKRHSPQNLPDGTK